MLKSFSSPSAVILLLFSQRFFQAWFSLEVRNFPYNSLAFFHCSKFSNSPGRIWIMVFSHACIWWQICFLTTESKDELFFSVIGLITMSSLSRESPRAKVQFLILGKHCVKILNLGPIPDFSAWTCLTCYWSSLAEIIGSNSGEILIDSKTCWAKGPCGSPEWLQKHLENWQKVGKRPKLVIISDTLE